MPSMDTLYASKLFEALASPVRLAVFQELTAAGGGGMIAGDLAKTLSLAPNNLSFHLKTLLHADLVWAEQEGRFVRYYANLPLMMDVVLFLTANCCRKNDAGACRNFCGETP